jgi:hypothetical protein
MLDVKFERYLPSKMVRENTTSQRAAQLLRQYPRNFRIAEGVLAIESAFLRGTIISAAREAAFAGSPSEPPKNSAQPPTFPRTCAISPNLLLPANAQQAHWDS